MRKVFIGGFLFVGLFIAGLLFLIRGCLSGYDERFALAPVLHFKNGSGAVLFSLVQNEETTSYSRNGGMVHKSVNTTYLIQQNDPETGASTAVQTIKKHRDIKHFPVEIMGASEGLAWVYMGEPMAFDPFTLEKKADIAELEKRNPVLKGKFPDERRFYRFNTADRQLYVTAIDGTKWTINTTTLLANASEEDAGKEPELESAQRQLRSAVESLQRLKPSYSQIKTNQDTMAGQWYGLYAANEWTTLYERVQHQSAYDETARRQFYAGRYGPTKNGIVAVDKTTTQVQTPSPYFLHGGFLLNKSTALPIRLANPAGYLIVHKEQIGAKGNILLGRIDDKGVVVWVFNTALADWVDWLYTGDKLFVMGVDNRELSGDQSNLLWCINLLNGTAARYDYFTDKK